MNTRFDGRLWIGALGVTFKVKEMETRHLLNTVKMLLQKTYEKSQKCEIGY